MSIVAVRAPVKVKEKTARFGPKTVVGHFQRANYIVCHRQIGLVLGTLNDIVRSDILIHGKIFDNSVISQVTDT